MKGVVSRFSECMWATTTYVFDSVLYSAKCPLASLVITFRSRQPKPDTINECECWLAWGKLRCGHIQWANGNKIL